jgi:hypothetical protein
MRLRRREEERKEKEREVRDKNKGSDVSSSKPKTNDISSFNLSAFSSPELVWIPREQKKSGAPVQLLVVAEVRSEHEAVPPRAENDSDEAASVGRRPMPPTPLLYVRALAAAAAVTPSLLLLPIPLLLLPRALLSSAAASERRMAFV